LSPKKRHYHGREVEAENTKDQDDTKHTKASQAQVINHTLENGIAQRESAPLQDIHNHLDASPNALADSNVPGRPADQPDESVVSFELINILDFLQQYKASCPKLRMTCPWDGIPLPFIDAELDLSLGLKTKIELSHELGARFIKYIRASRVTAAKVPH
jgi:hypothetical protein